MNNITVKEALEKLEGNYSPTLKDTLKKLGVRYSPAFEFYIKKLNQGEKLPRGKYFKNRTPIKKTYRCVDEFWKLNTFNNDCHVL